MPDISQSTPTSGTFVRMGEWLSIDLQTDLDAMELAAAGLSMAQFRRVAKRFDLPFDLPASASTVRRREEQRARFTQTESERVLRVLRVIAEASDFFEDDARALEWMRRPANFVPGEAAIAPIELARSELGARHIEGLLRSSAHGFF